MTDRLVLDRQLQTTVTQFEQTPGVVKKIDGTSAQLKAALASGAQDHRHDDPEVRDRAPADDGGAAGAEFALIVDEAHGSQSGKSAQALTNALTREATSSEDVEDIVAGRPGGAGAATEHQLLRLHGDAAARDAGAVRGEGRGRAAAPLPPLLDAAGDRGGVHPRRAPELHDLPAYYELEKAIDDDPELQDDEGAAAGGAVRPPAPDRDRRRRRR